MQFDRIEIVAFIAGAIGSFAFAPQAIKLLRDKQAENISATTYAMVLVGAGLWTTYGLLRQAPAIIFWNLVAGSLAFAVLWLKIHYDDATRRSSKGQADAADP